MTLLGVVVFVGEADPERFVVLVIVRQVDIRHEMHGVEPKGSTHSILPELFLGVRRFDTARAGRRLCAQPFAYTLVANRLACKRILERRRLATSDPVRAREGGPLPLATAPSRPGSGR